MKKVFIAKSADQQSDEYINAHLWTMLSVSSGMVGICATAIGLIGIFKTMKGLELIVDELFAIGALLFLAVTGLAFLGLRTRVRNWMSQLLLSLDLIFFIGLGVVVVASVLLTYVVI